MMAKMHLCIVDCLEKCGVLPLYLAAQVGCPAVAGREGDFVLPAAAVRPQYSKLLLRLYLMSYRLHRSLHYARINAVLSKRTDPCTDPWLASLTAPV